MVKEEKSRNLARFFPKSLPPLSRLATSAPILLSLGHFISFENFPQWPQICKSPFTNTRLLLILKVPLKCPRNENFRNGQVLSSGWEAED